ncbi:phosphoglycerate mutase-like protein [Suillus subaureus]|uniref:Phosphoglycerate mutase-like protein n=1 Tax=Suillus subaureus TaxID=48587 RepID=A0A9P7ECR7_9AGAM|nr:phosphoglycerate mutase-like protein [Suillus subaureus]KAG1818118.1 phosphoglycerate mutase-like protein [Suillus subaureus]
MGGQSRVYLGDLTLPSSCLSSARRSLFLRIGTAFFAGFFVCLAVVAQYVSSNQSCLPFSLFTALLPSHVGAPEWHEYPPAEPTNAFPSMFPSSVGSPGPTQAGAEPGVAATAPAYPLHSGVVHLVSPTRFSQDNVKDRTKDFDIFRSWGSLSPWYSVQRGKFGIDSGPEAPDTCNITGVHLLHRHGARYPGDYSNGTGPGRFALKLNRNAENVTATGPLSFLDDWTYKLVSQGLTHFGRSQLYDLGVSMRMRYGFLLKNFSETNTLPVFRTASATRVLNSAQNFALGFFGYPLEGQYQQQIMIEAKGSNNSLCPQRSCANNDDPDRGYRSQTHVNTWKAVYLKDTVPRLQQYLDGFELDVEDAYAMQELCAYESVALGYSKFCELFTEKEWEGFDYARILIKIYRYIVAWGSPFGRAEGIGYVQELVSRLTQTPIETHNSSTDATLHNAVTFPLGHSLYVDATHKTVVLSVLTALNLSSFAAMGPLPTDHIPEQRTFRTTDIGPFATNVQFQLLSCSTEHDPQIRVIINDGVAPLANLKGCQDHPDGMCSVHAFVDAQKENIRSTDWDFVCNADWTIPDGWKTTMGYPPL